MKLYTNKPILVVVCLMRGLDLHDFLYIGLPGHESTSDRLFYCLFAQYLPHGGPSHRSNQCQRVCPGTASVRQVPFNFI